MIFKPLELNKYVKAKYGNNARVIALNDHLYSLRIELNGKQYHLDINAAAKWFYGPNYIAIATGVHKFDWKAFNINELSYVVLPVLVVSKNMWGNINGVRKAKQQVLQALKITQSWYHKQVGKTFRFVNDVVVIDSPFDSNQWNYFAQVTNRKDSVQPDPFPNEDNRFILKDRLQGRTSQVFGNLKAHNVIFFSTPFTGLGKHASGAGAGACRSDNFAAQPPAISEPFSNPADVIYSVGHELGHTFHLSHTCDMFPGNAKCWDSIMQNPNRAKMTLLPQEKQHLINNPFFNVH